MFTYAQHAQLQHAPALFDKRDLQYICIFICPGQFSFISGISNREYIKLSQSGSNDE